MQLFHCPDCGRRLFFGNLQCACGAPAAFDPETQGFASGVLHCGNRSLIGCNWIAGAGGLCRSCAMTEVLPDLSVAGNTGLLVATEAAKRWVLANLGRWGWFTMRDAGPRPVFHMLAEATQSGPAEVSMGHAAGTITINVVEADPAEQVRRREGLNEPFRTVIGHIRHELAHFLFQRLEYAPQFVAGFRGLFGDEQQDYTAALQRHYQVGPPAGWPERHISAYAAAHPHEDWAESTAHLLHLTDIVDSFVAAGLAGPDIPGSGYDAYAEASAERLITRGAALGVALNHVNRSMGLADLYPFMHSPAISEKLVFVHGWIRQPAHA